MTIENVSGVYTVYLVADADFRNCASLSCAPSMTQCTTLPTLYLYC